MRAVKPGDKVKIFFEGTTKSGDEFASNTGTEPFELQLGNGEFWPSVESALIGMAKGQKKSVTLSEDEAIPYMDDLIFEFDKEQLPQEMEVEKGTILQMMQPDGSTLPVTIIEVKEDHVMLDANHPLAGEQLTFSLELIEIC
jgi:peptidylprolyl isomerase